MPNDDKPPIKSPLYGVPAIVLKGNADAKILAEAYQEYASDGLTLSEKQNIEKLNEILKEAEIVISPDNLHATIAQADNVFEVRPAVHTTTQIEKPKSLPEQLSGIMFTDMIGTKGNADARILDKAYTQFLNGGLTAEERVKIEKLDSVLKDASIIISPDGYTASIIQSDGMTFGKSSGFAFGIKKFGYTSTDVKGK